MAGTKIAYVKPRKYVPSMDNVTSRRGRGSRGFRVSGRRKMLGYLVVVEIEASLNLGHRGLKHQHGRHAGRLREA